MADCDPHWYRSAFFRDYTKLVTDSFAPERTEAEVDFYAEALSLGESARILDLCCGHGRHSLSLARRGHRVTGLDLEETALARARERAEAEDLGVEWIRADMREIPGDGEYDAVLSLHGAFGYLESEEEDAKVLAGVTRALKPGGGFLVETINPIWLFRHWEARRWDELPGGGKVLYETSFDATTGRTRGAWIWIPPDGATRNLEHSMRQYLLHEWARILDAAGLSVESAWGGVDGSEYGFDTRRMIILARRSR